MNLNNLKSQAETTVTYGDVIAFIQDLVIGDWPSATKERLANFTLKKVVFEESGGSLKNVEYEYYRNPSAPDDPLDPKEIRSKLKMPGKLVTLVESGIAESIEKIKNIDLVDKLQLRWIPKSITLSESSPELTQPAVNIQFKFTVKTDYRFHDGQVVEMKAAV